MWNNINYVNNIRLIIEIIYFLCSPLLVIAGFYALKQIKITKKINQNNSLRESYKLSAEQCKIFKDEIIPMCRTLSEKFKKSNINILEESKVIIEQTKISIKPCQNKDEYKKLEPYLADLADLVNSLEAFSLYFVTRIANENVAYLTVGSVYCDTIEQYFAIIFPTLHDTHSPILVLFFKWRERKRLEDLKIKKENLQKEIKNIEINESDTTIETDSFRPIGC